MTTICAQCKHYSFIKGGGTRGSEHECLAKVSLVLDYVTGGESETAPDPCYRKNFGNCPDYEEK